MSRLTDINKCIVNYKKSYTDEEISNIIVKLGKLEDVEEELGCPLEIVFKALKQGYIFVEWSVKYGLTKEKITHLTYLKEIGVWCFKKIVRDSNGNYCEIANLPINHYKKSWWTKKDKSE